MALRVVAPVALRREHAGQPVSAKHTQAPHVAWSRLSPGLLVGSARGRHGYPETEAKFTYADYRNAPEDKRYELLDGELVVSPAPKEVHQRALGNLSVELKLFARKRGVGRVYLSPFDVVLTDTDVVQPDLLFVCNERAGIVTEDNAQGAPDLVIEILSPSIHRRERSHVQARCMPDTE